MARRRDFVLPPRRRIRRQSTSGAGLLARATLSLATLRLSAAVFVPRALVAPALAALTVSAPLAAQPPSGQGTAQIARDLFERGKEKWTLGHYEEAASLLAASNLQSPRAGTCMLLADAYERLGRLRAARDTFQLASKLAQGSGDGQLEYRANTREAALLPRLPRIEVRVPQPLPPGLLVTLNGVELSPAELNAPSVLDAGAYHLEARAPGYRSFSRDVQLSNDGPQPLGTRVISVVLVRGDDSDIDAPASSPNALAGWFAGAGGALALGGVVALLVALDRNGDSESECGLIGGAATDDENACTRRGADLRSDARTFAHLATAGTVLGLAGIGAGVTLYFTANDPAGAQTGGVRWQGTF